MSSRYLPIYVVYDCGTFGWFVGTRRNELVDSIQDEAAVNMRLFRPFEANICWPDGTEDHAEVLAEMVQNEVHDTGHSYTVTSPRFFVWVEVHGVRAKVAADYLSVDPTTIKVLPSFFPESP